MKCTLPQRHEAIADYLTNELSEEQTIDFEEHYLQCDVCFKELRVAEDAMNLIEDEGPSILAAPETRTRNLDYSKRKLGWQPRWGFAIASVSVVAVIGFIVLTNLNETDLDNLSGPSFAPEPYLEEWVTQSTRAGDEIIDTVFSPEPGEKLDGGQITFQWTMLERIPVSLKILSNLEEEIFTSTPELEQFPQFTIEVDTEIFKEGGLYYWRIEDKENVFFVGKFYFLGKDL